MKNQLVDLPDNRSAFEAVLAIVRRRKWIIVLFGAVPLAFMLAVIISMPDLYQAHSVLTVDRLEGDDPRNVEVSMLRISKENTSRTRLLALIQEFSLYPELKAEAVSDDQLVERMRRDIRVETEKIPQGWGDATVSLAVSYLAPEPKLAATITERLASFFVDQDAEQRRIRAEERYDVLSKQVAVLEKKLAEEEERVRRFKSQYRHELPEQISANLAAIERLSAELRENRQAQLEFLGQLRGDASPRPRAEGGLPASTVDRLALEREYRALRTRYSSAHPDVRALELQLEAIDQGHSPEVHHDVPGQSANDSEVGAETSILSKELQKLQKESARISSAISQRTQDVRNAPIRAQQLESLLPAYDTLQAQYRVALKDLSEAALMRRDGALAPRSAFRVVDAPGVPREPAAPRRLRLAITAMIISSLIALGAVVLLERSDRSFHSVEELRAFTILPVLAVVPRVLAPAEVASLRRRRIAVAAVGLVALVAIIVATILFVRGNHLLVWVLAQQA